MIPFKPAAAAKPARGVCARLKELPWAALVVLILVLILILAMWGKLPERVRLPHEFPAATPIALQGFSGQLPGGTARS